MTTAIKVEVTPFFLYGMYSEKQIIPDTIKLNTVFLDSLSLEKVPLSFREKDLLLTTLTNYLAMKKNNDTDFMQTRVEQRYPFLTHRSFYPFLRNKIFNTSADIYQFEGWFKQKCKKLIKRNIKKVTVVENRYIIDPVSLSVRLVSREQIAFF